MASQFAESKREKWQKQGGLGEGRPKEGIALLWKLSESVVQCTVVPIWP